MFSAAAELKSKDRGRQGSLCSHQLFCWNLMAEKLHIWKSLVQGPPPGPGLCPDMTKDSGTQLCPFRWSRLFVSSPVHRSHRYWTVIRLLQKTLITGLKERVHCLFVPFLGPSHWSLTKGPPPFSSKCLTPFIFSTMQKPDFPFAEIL